MKKHSLIKAIIILTAFSVFFNAEARQSASGYSELVVDASNGNILHQVNSDKTRYPASLTKMMTLYLTFKSLRDGKIKMNQSLRTSRWAATRPPMGMGLRPGQSITVREAILSLIVKSANDAAVVLAEASGGTESNFSSMMTAEAKQLGMNRTNFMNASGLPHNSQYTTARDLAKLVIALQRDFPEYYPLFSRTSFSYRGRVYVGHNRVTKNYRGADGVKTGYIRASGYNLASSAIRGGKRIVGIVLGGKTSVIRDRRMVALLDSSFRKFNPAATNVAENNSVTKQKEIRKQPKRRSVKNYKKRPPAERRNRTANRPSSSLKHAHTA